MYKRQVLGRSVLVGEEGLTGVIGTKAVHMQTAEERETAVPMDSLYIDIGAKDKEEALSHVSLGDRVSFRPLYALFGEGFLRGKALDDRIGCAIMIDMICGELLYDTTFTFVVQEEVGLRGARAASYTVDPEIALEMCIRDSLSAGGHPADAACCTPFAFQRIGHAGERYFAVVCGFGSGNSARGKNSGQPGRHYCSILCCRGDLSCNEYDFVTAVQVH